MPRIYCIILTMLLLIPCISSAEIKTYTHTVKQSFAGSQSPDDARVAAIHKAKREVLEKAGTYLESLTIVKNNVVEKDEILALAAGVLKAEIVSEKKYLDGNEFGIYVSAKVDVDTNILEARVKKLLQDHEHLKRYKESQKREKELLAKIEQLEQENSKLRTSPASADIQKKKELKNQFREATQGLTAVEWILKALALWKDGQWTNPNQALDYLNRAIRLNPKLAGAYNIRGVAYLELGKHQRAIEDFDQAIRLDPKYAGAYNNRGHFYLNLGKHQRAIKDFDQAIRLDPGSAEAYNLRGLAYDNLGKHQRAIEDLDQAIRLNPKYVAAYNFRGLAYDNLGKHQRAIKDYDQAIRLDPGSAEAYNIRGLAYLKLGKNQRAIEDLDQAIRLDPGSADFYGARGLAYDNLGKHQRAIKDYDQAIRLDPRSADFYDIRGFAYLELGMINSACYDLRKACELGNCAGLNGAKEKGNCR